MPGRSAPTTGHRTPAGDPRHLRAPGLPLAGTDNTNSVSCFSFTFILFSDILATIPVDALMDPPGEMLCLLECAWVF